MSFEDIISFPTTHPALVGWFTSSVSLAVVFKLLWGWLTAPLITCS
jgi:hypothetical protein